MSARKKLESMELKELYAEMRDADAEIERIRDHKREVSARIAVVESEMQPPPSGTVTVIGVGAEEAKPSQKKRTTKRRR